MLNITHAEASKNILRAVRTRTLVQAEWHTTTENGKAIACLLGSIHPTVTSAAECNGDLMPMWLAELTPTLFDGIPKNNIYPIAKRYGTLVAQWHQLTQTQWQTILNKFLILTIDTALNAARPINVGKPYWDQVETACNKCKEAIINNNKDSAAGTARAAANVARAASADASHDANAASRAANTAPTPAACAAATTYAAAAFAASRAATRATYAANAAAYADAVCAAADAAFAASRAARAAANAAAFAAAYLSLFTFLLDQIEEECANHD